MPKLPNDVKTFITSAIVVTGQYTATISQANEIIRSLTPVTISKLTAIMNAKEH